MTDIPIELFAVFVGSALAIMTIGLAKKIGIALVISGMFLVLVALLTDTIILGKIPESSITIGATTTYIMIDNIFIFTEWHKIIMMLMGSFIMILGSIIGIAKQ